MIIPYTAFSVTKDDGKITFSAELSDFNGETVFHRVDDEFVITVRGLKNVVDYVRSYTDYDGEGDVRFYRLRPTDHSYDTILGCRNTEIILFND